MSKTTAPILASSDAAALPEGAPRKSQWLGFDRLFLTTACSLSLGFFIVAYTISTVDPEYFGRRMLATMQPATLDPIMTGTVAPKVEGGMPAPRIVRAREPVPADYQIVMVFDDEAILATADELVRVKVGTVVPGLGTVTSIEASDAGGGVVATTEATLRSVN